MRRASILEATKTLVAAASPKPPGALMAVQTGPVAKARVAEVEAVPTVDDWDQNPAALAAVPPKAGSQLGERATTKTLARARLEGAREAEPSARQQLATARVAPSMHLPQRACRR